MLKAIKGFIRTMRCKHTHTFRFNLPENTPWYSSGVKKGAHSGLQVVGCYICGKVWCRDHEA